DGEPELTVITRWNPAPAHDFRRIPEAHLFYRAGRVFNRHAVSGVAVPGDPALARHLADFVASHPDVEVDPPARSLIGELVEAHVDRLISLAPAAVVLDESHYVKNPQAGRTKAALALASALPPDALRLALTGTPILNRAEELVTQLRVLDRLREFGSGARLSRRFRSAGSDDRLHWNLRAIRHV